jgi:hypothetical protein
VAGSVLDAYLHPEFELDTGGLCESVRVHDDGLVGRLATLRPRIRLNEGRIAMHCRIVRVVPSKVSEHVVLLRMLSVRRRPARFLHTRCFTLPGEIVRKPRKGSFALLSEFADRLAVGGRRWASSPRSGATMRGTESLRFGPRFEDDSVTHTVWDA